MEKLKAVILSAGEGKRMNSARPKVLHEVLGVPMVSCVISAAKAAGAEAVCVVVGHKGDEVKEALKDSGVSFAVQAEQRGTGHAVMQAGDFISEGTVLVLCGDTPVVSGETLESFVKFHSESGNDASLISAFAKNAKGYGRIVRENGEFIKIVEEKDASESERLINEVNTGIYCFKGEALKSVLGRLRPENAQNEYYLTDTLELIMKGGGRAGVMTAGDFSEFAGVNSREQLAEVISLMRGRINKKHMENGVTIVSPETTYISPLVEIGRDTVILPGVMLEGATSIGENCEIGPDCRIRNCKLENGVKALYSTALDSQVGEGSAVGPYAYIRPNSRIGKNVKVGDFVEIKNSVIGDGTKISHLTYIGDTDAGKKINFGCGTVTVNYDGNAKYRTTVEDNAFIGCNANLIAPVTVKKGAYVAAGSTITADVPEESLAVARERQRNIKDWVKSFKSRKQG